MVDAVHCCEQNHHLPDARPRSLYLRFEALCIQWTLWPCLCCYDLCFLMLGADKKKSEFGQDNMWRQERSMLVKFLLDPHKRLTIFRVRHGVSEPVRFLVSLH